MGAFRDWAPQAGSRWAPSRYTLAGALLAALIVTGAAALALGVGSPTRAGTRARGVAATGHRGHPSATGIVGGAGESTAGTTGAGNASAGEGGARSQTASGAGSRGGGDGSAASSARGRASSTPSAGGGASARAKATEVRDPLESSSYPAPAGVHHSAAHTPRHAAEAVVAPGAASDAEIREELQRMRQLERQASALGHMATVPGGDSIAANGGKLAIPQGVPEVVQRVIAGANAIADFPYVYGGGHVSFVDTAYDCSGSVSYALAAGGLLRAPETSGQLESWGAPGQGRWITVYANAGHTYMYVNVGGRWMLYDTAGRSGVLASRWQPSPVDNAGYVARHWPGL